MSEDLLSKLKNNPELYEEYTYYNEHNDFLCKYKVAGYSIVDILVWQMDHFRAYLDRDVNKTKYDKSSMIENAFETMLKMAEGPEKYVQLLQTETGTDF